MLGSVKTEFALQTQVGKEKKPREISNSMAGIRQVQIKDVMLAVSVELSH